MTSPLRELTIRDERTADGYTTLKVLIDNTGQLVLEGVDGGEQIRKIWGDFDYEYWVRIAPEWKDTIVLHLIKELFANGMTSSQFMAWLKVRGIGHKFDSYA